MNGYVALRVQRINHEAVGGKNSFFIAQVQHHQIAVDGAAAFNLLTGTRGVVTVQLHALYHIGQAQNVFNAVGAAVVNKIHHQLVVADAKLPKAPQAGTRVHQVIQQHPVCWR